MDRFFTVLERFAPEAVELIVIRYQILRQVMHQQPVGRRQLVKSLGYTERTVRNEIEVLRERGAIHSTPAGITLGSGGEELLKEIDELITLFCWIFTPWEKGLNGNCNYAKSSWFRAIPGRTRWSKKTWAGLQPATSGASFRRAAS